MFCRYYELEEIYGKLNPLVNLDFKTQTEVKMMVRLMNEGLEQSETIIVDIRGKVKDLKKQLESFCGVRSSKFRLYYVETYGIHPVEMIYPTKEIRTYHMTEEDELHVYLR